MIARQPTPADWVSFVVLVAFWGTAFAFTGRAVEAAPATVVVAVRLWIGAAMVVGWALMQGHTLPPLRSTNGGVNRRWLWFAALGFCGNTLPFFLISWGQKTTPSGVAGVLMAVMPLATVALGAALLKSERLNARRVAGFIVGFIGVAVLMGPDAVAGLGGDGLIAQAAILGGAISYAVNAVLARLAPENAASVTAGGMLVAAAVLATPFAIHSLITDTVSPDLWSWVSMVALGVGATGLAAIVYIALIRSAGPGFVSLNNYFIPPIAVALGVALGEPAGPELFVALVLVCLAAWLGARQPR